METKYCCKCNKTKPVTEFSKNSAKKDGLQSFCKDCCSAYKRKHYREHKEDYINRNKRYAQDAYSWYRDYKETLRCSVCGEDRWWCLDFHHTDPETKEFNVSDLVRYPNKLKEEIDKCEVLCANCHRCAL